MDIAIAVFTATSSEVIAQGNLHDFRSELNQIYWRICCANREDVIKSNETYKNYSWIRDKNYKDSRSKVIGEAIGDCVAGKNEFAGKTAEDIITFEGTSPENYEQKHWNAVILYNYVHEMINNPNTGSNISNVKEVLNKNEKFNTIQEYYKERCNLVKNALSARLEKSVDVIQAYVEALQLNTELDNFRTRQQLYNDDKRIVHIAPGVGKSSSDESLSYTTDFLWQDSQRHRMLYSPTFRYDKGGLYIENIMRLDQYFSVAEEYSPTKWFDNETEFFWAPLNSTQQDELKWLFDRLAGLVKLLIEEKSPSFNPDDAEIQESPTN